MISLARGGEFKEIVTFVIEYFPASSTTTGGLKLTNKPPEYPSGYSAENVRYRPAKKKRGNAREKLPVIRSIFPIWIVTFSLYPIVIFDGVALKPSAKEIGGFNAPKK